MSGDNPYGTSSGETPSPAASDHIATQAGPVASELAEAPPAESMSRAEYASYMRRRPASGAEDAALSDDDPAVSGQPGEAAVQGNTSMGEHGAADSEGGAASSDAGFAETITHDTFGDAPGDSPSGTGSSADGGGDSSVTTTDMTAEPAALEAEVAGLKADSSVLRKENTELRAKVADLEAGNAVRDEQNEELQARLADLEAKDTRRDAEADALRAQLARVAAMADDMRKELDARKDAAAAIAPSAGALADRSGQLESVKGEKAHEQQRSGRFSNEVIGYAIAATGVASTVAGDAFGTEAATVGGIITAVAGLGAAHIAWRRSRKEKQDHGDQNGS